MKRLDFPLDFPLEWVTPCGGSQMALTWDGNKVFIESIFTKPEYRGRGLAGGLLRQVCDILDEEGVTACLIVAPDLDRPGLTREQLVEWYEGYGFEATGWYKYRMNREPQEESW